LAQRLLPWFLRHQRDLPWRYTRDPYAIWVSEVMLQQTQVVTVIPFYHRFLRAFPTLGALAAASETEVLRLWEGLGFYRRARALHAGARWLVAEHAGQIADDPDVFAQVPGVGRYTLGAVLSQAFDHRLPILEANSVRVLCRLFGLRADPRRGATQKQLWQLAEDVLPRSRAGTFNQALMELGALICTPAAPRCEACPIRSLCVAHKKKQQAIIPLRPPTATTVPVEEVAIVVWKGGRVLLVQRPPEGRWGGLWEFPHAPLEDGETHATAAGRVLREHAALRITAIEQLAIIRHSLTRYRITLVAMTARYRGGRFSSEVYPQGLWLRPTELTNHPLSAPQRRLAEMVAAARDRVCQDARP
jgi:A/G-specific adenine glycosylase